MTLPTHNRFCRDYLGLAPEPKPEPAPEPAAIGVGTIWCCSWGYDQTNIDFYEVVKRTPKTVVIRKIESVTVDRSKGSDKVVPCPGHFDGDPMRRRVLDGWHPSAPLIRISEGRTIASLWDGKPKHQTASGYGH